MGRRFLRGLYAGRFDPPTRGHGEIVRRARELFDELLVGVSRGAGPRALLSAEERVGLLEVLVRPFENVRVEAYEGLTADFAAARGVTHLVRGVRTEADLARERELAWGNESLGGGLATVLFLASPAHATVSSHLVREVIGAGGVERALRFVPDELHEGLRAALGGEA